MRSFTVLALIALIGCAPAARSAPPAVLAVAPIPARPAPPAPPVATTPSEVEPADRMTFLAFLPRYLRFKKQAVPAPETLARRIEGETQFTENQELPERFFLFERVSLYIADVNNDGMRDYVLVDQNPVSLHNDTVLGVFDNEGLGTLRELTFYDDYRTSLFPPDATDGESQLPYHRDHPFIAVTDQGTVMRFTNVWYVDKDGEGVMPWSDKQVVLQLDEKATYLWKDARVSELTHTKTETRR